jgi:hypothetical protein
MNDDDTRPVGRDASGRFSHGNPGRPKGARNRTKKIRDLFSAALAHEHDHYVAYLRDNHPDVVLAALMGFVDGKARVRVPPPPQDRPTRRRRRPLKPR